MNKHSKQKQLLKQRANGGCLGLGGKGRWRRSAQWGPRFCCCCFLTKSRPTLCDPVGCCPPGSSVHGILQARILEWVAISSPGGPPHPRIKPASPAWQADSLPLSHLGSPSLSLGGGRSPRGAVVKGAQRCACA